MTHAYPRPQLQRSSWVSLNGAWDFALDAAGTWSIPSDVEWKDVIQVPFAPETPASGIAYTGFFRACWYRRSVPLPAISTGNRLLVHFGAVDYRATVWINGCEVRSHEGGYTPFTVELSAFDIPSRLEIVVRAEDDPSDLSQPRGKQDWQLNPHSICTRALPAYGKPFGTKRYLRRASIAFDGRRTSSVGKLGLKPGWRVRAAKVYGSK